MKAEDDDAADRAFEQRARAELRRGVEQTPPQVRVQLDRIVDRALRPPPRPGIIRYAVPVGAVALLAAALVVAPWRTPDVPANPAADDFALLMNVDNLDLLEQMEFYQWLDRQPGALDAALAASESAQRS